MTDLDVLDDLDRDLHEQVVEGHDSPAYPDLLQGYDDAADEYEYEVQR
jgi:hypothetical protein